MVIIEQWKDQLPCLRSADAVGQASGRDAVAGSANLPVTRPPTAMRKLAT